MKVNILIFLLLMLLLAGQANPVLTNDSTLINTTAESLENKAQPKPKALSTAASYTGDIGVNLKGGIKTGAVFLGMANLKLGFDTQKAKLWKGGQFFINGAVTHGKSPSELLVGDFQTVSNIDAGDHIYIHELWYKHQFKRFEITFGLQDLNQEFASSNNGSSFINSSFGIPPVISDNIPAPIFPLTALGITTKMYFNDDVSITTAIYDGCPTAFEHNVYNTKWHLCTDDGSLILAELNWSTNLFQLPGFYKTGYYFHSGLHETDHESGAKAEVFDKNYGVYFLADQTLWKNTGNNRSVSMFAQFTLSPASINNHYSYVGGGINYVGVSKKQPEDMLGLAVACAGFIKEYKKDETTIELYYKKQMGENLTLQPDLQYVIHPAGTNEQLPDALVGILRFILNF